MQGDRGGVGGLCPTKLLPTPQENIPATWSAPGSVAAIGGAIVSFTFISFRAASFLRVWCSGAGPCMTPVHYAPQPIKFYRRASLYVWRTFGIKNVIHYHLCVSLIISVIVFLMNMRGDHAPNSARRTSSLVSPAPPRLLSFQLCNPSSAALCYTKPLDFARVPGPNSNLDAPPFVKILASPAERIRLLKNLASSGRLSPLKQVAHERAEWGVRLFCVAKDAERDRLVLDARPANQLVRTSLRAARVHSLASAAALSGIMKFLSRIRCC